eukprot:CAMPEP_0206326080 /NCGR_PEP_ID=MMETSP0106_2-20121207/21422_1 /ASSEMBLY_ACC=CAM_ASM_000206 /TAXON_ID=81532 /ORGANISM="Acanthoeca-like sp., Strain 10tr" /LENGTH=141 /DNA_ID=CAMNT_0053758603 /DNA_START=37 /DNA_END=459 /DNA_ORIENTATION=-
MAYVCELCGSTATDLQALSVHIQQCQSSANAAVPPAPPTVPLDRPYVCELCPFSATDRATLEGHIETHGSGTRGGAAVDGGGPPGVNRPASEADAVDDLAAHMRSPHQVGALEECTDAEAGPAVVEHHGYECELCHFRATS